MLLGEDSRPAPTSIADDAQAERIFHAARMLWNNGNYPRYTTYLVRVSYTKGGNPIRPIVRHYDTYEDMRRNLVYARAFSREEEAVPYIMREVAQGPLDFGKAGIAREVIVSFENVMPLSSIPLPLTIGISDPAEVTGAN